MTKHSLDKELIEKWKEMYELTRPKCNECNSPRSCCSPEYCEMAMTIAEADWGLKLVPTGHHPTLPLMGPDGCVAPPHTRPLCTIHVCEGTFWRSPMSWKKQYMALRAKLDALEQERHRSKE